MTKNPIATENTLDFALSFASAFTGRTMMRPIHTITPIAITLVTICTLRITAAVMVRKSDPDSTTARLTLESVFIPILGLQFLNSSRISPLPKTQLAAYV